MLRALRLTAAMAAPAAADPARVVGLGGSVTEIAFAIGAGDLLIVRNSSSTFPPEALALADGGYVRQLSPEGGLSAAPDLILTEEGGWKPMTEEAILTAAPDVVMMCPGDPAADKAAAFNQPDGMRAQVLGQPAIVASPAGRNGVLVVMQGLHLLGARAPGRKGCDRPARGDPRRLWASRGCGCRRPLDNCQALRSVIDSPAPLTCSREAGARGRNAGTGPAGRGAERSFAAGRSCLRAAALGTASGSSCWKSACRGW